MLIKTYKSISCSNC